MPEGAEVRIIAEGLRSHLELSRITGIEVLGGRYERHGIPAGFDGFRASLPLVCDNVGVRGKFIFLTFRAAPDQPCAHGWSMWNTLGMTGVWLKERTDHARLSLTYENIFAPYSEGTLYFDDVRNFGTLRFSQDRDELQRKLASFGLDMLNGSYAPKDTQTVLLKKRNANRTLAEVLMDQRCFAGVGNYVKAEVLYRARLSPHRLCGSLSGAESCELHDRITEVLHGSYQARGVTLSDYRDIDGKEGVFALQVYGRINDPSGNPVVREETKDGRVTHWVPNVQR